jgi:hypothetical protein
MKALDDSLLLTIDNMPINNHTWLVSVIQSHCVCIPVYLWINLLMMFIQTINNNSCLYGMVTLFSRDILSGQRSFI